MSVYTNPPEWEAQGKKPPSSKRTEGWKPGDRVPASWLNWFWFSTVNSLREIAQAFVNHRDASAPHDGHETKEGATAKVEAHSQKITAVHGVGQQYVAKTSRPDQWPSWNDIQDKPSAFPADAATLPQASTSQAGIVQLTNSRTSTSETLAVTAKALNDHRNSADHDGRYYTKAQVEALIASGGPFRLMLPSDDILAEALAPETRTISTIGGNYFEFKAFRVWALGWYRITGEASSGNDLETVWIRITRNGSTNDRLTSDIAIQSSSYIPFSVDTGLVFPGDRIEVRMVTDDRATVSIRNVRLRGTLSSAPNVEVLNP